MPKISLAEDHISEERKKFLDTALDAHLGAELMRDVPGIVETFSETGHLNFNGEIYETPKDIAAFHDGLGFSDLETGLIRNLRLVSLTKIYSHDCVLGEFRLAGEVNVPLGGEKPGYTAEWSVCAVYQFDETGKLISERPYFDTGGLMPTPVVPDFSADR